MDLQSLCTTYLRARGSDGFDDVAEGLAGNVRATAPLSSEDWAWLRDALEDDQRKWFVAFLVEVLQSVPEALYEPMIRAAVYEINPSFNRSFIEPCIKTHGYRRVNMSLLDFLEKGDDFEKAGAANALYWSGWRNLVDGPLEEMAENKRQHAELNDVWDRRRSLMLKEFVRNSNVDVRRAIIGKLSLKAEAHPPEFLPLVVEAIEVGKNSADEYIRHRVEIQLGEVQLGKTVFQALSHRKPPSA